MRKLQLLITLILLLASISSIYAYNPIEVNAATSWNLDSLPCRPLTYELDIINNDNAIRNYHLSIAKYPNYVKFSENDFAVKPGNSKRVAVYAVLPCSVSGDIKLVLNIAPAGLNYVAKLEAKKSGADYGIIVGKYKTLVNLSGHMQNIEDCDELLTIKVNLYKN